MLREYWKILKVQKGYKEWNSCNNSFEKYIEEVRKNIIEEWKEI